MGYKSKFSLPKFNSKASLIYFVYSLSIIIIIVYSSIWLVKQYGKPQYELVTPITGKYTNITAACPCKKIGIDPSRCGIRYARKSKNPLLYGELIPGFEQLGDGGYICIPSYWVKINSVGFRDYEYSLKKPNYTFRIIVLGDSITFGVGLNLEETYSKVLERTLNERGKINYQVLNFGVPGYNVVEKVEIFSERGINFEPDLVIFQYLDNDIIDQNEIRDIQKRKIKEYLSENNKTYNELTRLELIEITENIYSQYVDILEDKDFEDVWRPVEESFERLASISGDTIDIVLLTHGSSIQHRFKLKEISKRYGWPIVIPDYNYSEEELIIHPKDPHPNALANKIMAEEILKTLIEKGVLPEDL